MESLNSENDFVVIDLPVRFSTSELRRLYHAIAKAIKRETPLHVYLPSDEMISALDEAKRLIRIRRAREKAFGGDLFGDPSWDLLLDLFVAEGTNRRVSVSSACIGSTAPSTTALRHLTNLERRGWVLRDASADDQRVVYVRLSDEAIRIMQRLLAPL